MAKSKFFQLAAFLFCFMAVTAVLPGSIARAAEADATAAPTKAVHHAKKAKAPAKVHEAAAAADGQYVEGGAKTCLQCHETTNTVMEIFQTPHGQKGDPRTPAAAHECETCHGSGSTHINGPERTNIGVVFTKNSPTPIAEQNKMCLACHEGGKRINWPGSKHQSADVACASCHTIHVKKDPVLAKVTQSEKCFTCHAQQRAESFEYSHHPIREGKVACSDCHNPHGSMGPKLLKEANVNQTCYTCHADKRGPFLFEHQPVRDNCTNCHTPHGSTEARLMKERMNFMCSSCHSAISANSGGAFGGNASIPHNAQGTVFGASALANQRQCLNCHSQIHGSNSPAGVSFMR